MTTNNSFGVIDPILSLLLDLDTIDGSQITEREPLFQDALKRIRKGDDELCDLVEKKLLKRQARLQQLQNRVAFAYRDNFNLLAEVLGARKVRSIPHEVDILATGAPFPVTAAQRELMKQKVDVLSLTNRVRNALIGENIYTVEDLLERRLGDLMKVPTLGSKSIAVIREALAAHDLRIGHLYDPGKPKAQGEAL